MEEIALKMKVNNIESFVLELKELMYEKNKEIQRLNKEVDRMRTLERNRCGYNSHNNPNQHVKIGHNHLNFLIDISHGKWDECVKMIDDGMVSPYEFDILKDVCSGAYRTKDEEGAIKFVKYLITEYKIDITNDSRTPIEFVSKHNLLKLSKFYEELFL